jgi:hypothetical protein
VIDHEDGELGDLIRLGADSLQRGAQIGVGLLDLDADLNATIWSLWNYVMGATVTRASFELSDEDRAAAQQRLAGLSERYPTIERSRLLLDDDWDGAFRKGLGFLLDGLSPRSA